MAKKALLIGVSQYEAGLPPLAAAPKDVAAMLRILQNPELGAFDEVKTLIDPDLEAMQTAIALLFQSCQKGDLGLLYFSGHGITDDGDRLYLATRRTSKNTFKANSVSASFIQNIMGDHHYERQHVLILDCCYSGAFTEGWQSKSVDVDLKPQLEVQGSVVLTSSTSTQKSYEDKEGELSLYTNYIVQGIESGAAEGDGDGYISADELHEYAKRHVQATKPAMKPEIYGVRQGIKIVLSKAKVDTKLEYRRLVEKYVDNGEISFVGREILDVRRERWRLSVEVATAIENEVVEPYRQRLRNLERYQRSLERAVQQQFPLTERMRGQLQDLQEVLGLRDEDISSIQNQMIAPLETMQRQNELEAERQRQADLEQQRQREANLELTRQRQELERKRQLDDEQGRQAELKRQQDLEAERQRQEELEQHRQREAYLELTLQRQEQERNRQLGDEQRRQADLKRQQDLEAVRKNASGSNSFVGSKIEGQQIVPQKISNKTLSIVFSALFVGTSAVYLLQNQQPSVTPTPTSTISTSPASSITVKPTSSPSPSQTPSPKNTVSNKTAQELFDEGGAKREKGDTLGAISVLNEAIKLNPNYVRAYARRGGLLQFLGQNDKAIADFKKAITLEVKTADDYLGRGTAKRALGDNQGAIADYNEAIRINPKDANAHNNRGIAKRALGDNQGAIADYNEAIRINPDFALAYVNRGSTKNDLGDNQGAIADYNEAIRINPDFADTYYNRGVAKRALGDNQGAIADYNEAIRLKPDLAYTYYNRGIAKLALGDNQGAIADYNEAIRLKPDLADPYYGRGLIKQQRGDKIEALADFRVAAQLYEKQGNTTWLNKSRDRIKELGG